MWRYITDYVNAGDQVAEMFILVDTETFTVSIPPEKLQVIKQMCLLWCSKNFYAKNELQSLLGSLLYVTKCIQSKGGELSKVFNTDNKSLALFMLKLAN